jgi:hypothetical protein
MVTAEFGCENAATRLHNRSSVNRSLFIIKNFG